MILLSAGAERWLTRYMRLEAVVGWLSSRRAFSGWLMTPGGGFSKCRLNRVCSWRRILTCPTPSTDSQSLSCLKENASKQNETKQNKSVGSTFSSRSNLCQPREAITFHCRWSKTNASALAIEVTSVVLFPRAMYLFIY